MSYGILSTIVVKAYEEGYVIGEVVGSQLLTGFLLFWGLAFFIHKRSHYFIVPVTWMGVLIHAISERKRSGAIMLLSLAVLFGGTLLARLSCMSRLAFFNGRVLD